MFLAAGGVPALATVATTFLGGTLAAGGANALNCFLDRDVDAIMHRTMNRPSATGQVSGRNIVIFGLALSTLAVVVLGLAVNALSAGLAAFAIAFYVLGYTLGVKRRTTQNIVWGGTAGCMPVLIGWSAVTGTLSWAPVALFLIVFFWTPPHYWPLSLRYRDDYERAGIPMLPVQVDALAVTWQILAYSWLMVLASVALVPIAGMGLLYTATCAVLGGLFLWQAYLLRQRVRRAEADLRPMALFHYSISYLALLFLAVGIDPFTR